MLHRSLTLETREIGLLQTATPVRISPQRIPQATLAESAKKNMFIALRKNSQKEIYSQNFMIDLIMKIYNGYAP